MTKFKTAYASHSRVQPTLNPKSMTHQSMAPECDINGIMKKYERTGILEHRNTFEGQYGSFIDGPADYHEAMNAVLEADEMFQTLPAGIRRRFHNDAGAFLEYANDPDNAQDMVRMGLATRTSMDVLDDPATPTPKKPSTAPKAPSSDSEEAKKGA